MTKNKLQTIVFGGGCFWCTEAIFESLKGVESVTSGYAGGEADNPNYNKIHNSNTGHAEVIEVKYDPSTIPTKDLIDIFFHSHDPTQVDGQGADLGPEYRSLLLYTTEEQKNIAQELMQPEYVTEIKKLNKFHKAEDYHQNYYQKNKNNRYCNLVINPKLQKLKIKYSKFVK